VLVDGWVTKPRFLCIQKAKAEASVCELLDSNYDAKTGQITVILSDEKSYNGSYDVYFELESFLQAAQIMVSPTTPKRIVHGKDATIEPVSFTDRLSTSISSDFLRKESTLVVQARDNMGNLAFEKDGAPTYKKDKSFGVGLTLGYRGVANPLQRITKEQSYYDLNLDVKLTELAVANDSKIALTATGITTFMRIKGSSSLVALSATTKQSLSQTSLTWEKFWRVGDRRTTGRGYYSDANVLMPVYAELGVQLGGSWYKRLRDVPFDGGATALIARPRLALGFFELSPKNAEMFVSGKVNLYYVTKVYGGTKRDRGLLEDFEVLLAFGPEERRWALKAKGGRDSAGGFSKMIPEYGIEITIKQ